MSNSFTGGYYIGYLISKLEYRSTLKLMVNSYCSERLGFLIISAGLVT